MQAMPHQTVPSCLRGVTVLCTGFPDQTRQELQKHIVDLGGSCILDYFTSSHPDVLVAQSVLSSKYKVLGPVKLYSGWHILGMLTASLYSRPGCSAGDSCSTA